MLVKVIQSMTKFWSNSDVNCNETRMGGGRAGAWRRGEPWRKDAYSDRVCPGVKKEPSNDPARISKQTQRP